MDFASLIFFFLIIIPSSIIHEYAHGWMALQLGDPTAKYAGRLTLNPVVHIDRWGTIIMPLMLYVLSAGSFIFAYAKPVPYNPYNLKNQKWGPAMVGLAGPASNLLVAIVFSVLINFIAPGSNIFAASNNETFLTVLGGLFSIIVYANIILAIFNLVPIPPLDGSKILYALLPDSAYKVREFLEKNGFWLIIFFLFFGFQLIQPIISFVYRLLVG